MGKIVPVGKRDPMEIYECFDGDLPEVANAKFTTIDDFKAAIDHFQQGEFAEATALFDRIIKKNPNDEVSVYFKNKAAQYTMKGVSDDWNGVEKLLEK